ncbi:hypothetical protein HYH02_005281 [Chlamydomonas schloesseri]|uniref:Uncharacterized protein n=1 Tax=Chlamydomonas schloesseri TaxID=2026947 RepID=A0A835WLR2_9CHLO|nr:hypothetical protein HYH02_005281 [Chlamydomonas schloesseri]|eukprot:KAG2449756.1 hypothetical protein HYH02_005281 [Chlamydomonas schloesseri]
MGRSTLGRLLAAAAVALALAACAARAGPAPVMQTWGPNPAPLTVSVPCGAPLTLTWDTGSDLQHNLVSIPAADCSQGGQMLVGTSSKGTWTTTFPRPGTYYYKAPQAVVRASGQGRMTARAPAGQGDGVRVGRLGDEEAAEAPTVLSWAFYDAPKVITLPCNSKLQLTWSGGALHDVVEVPAADCALDGPVVAASQRAGNWSRTFVRNGSYYFK